MKKSNNTLMCMRCGRTYDIMDYHICPNDFVWSQPMKIELAEPSKTYIGGVDINEWTKRIEELERRMKDVYATCQWLQRDSDARKDK